jgi:hypothetical protein
MTKQKISPEDPTVLKEISAKLSDFDRTFAKAQLDYIFSNFNKPHLYMYNWDIFLRCVLVFLVLDIPFVTVKVLCSRISQQVNQLRRKKYYSIENDRRRQFREERRKIHRRSTINKCPTPNEFMKAWEGSKTSLAGMLHFGGMVHDLSCFVDNSLRFNKSKTRIVGRNGGVKSWIKENVPDLLPKYKTIMRYHIAAVKIRQHTSLNDPMPTEMIDEAIEERQLWTTEKILSYAAQQNSSILKEIDKTLKYRYIPNSNLITVTTRKWANKAGFKYNSKDDKQIQKCFRRSITEALHILRSSIEVHIAEYFENIKKTIQKDLEESHFKSRERRKIINGRNKLVSNKGKKKKSLPCKIKKWRECKSWLFATLADREKTINEITGNIS